jgi:hypothetical protein
MEGPSREYSVGLSTQDRQPCLEALHREASKAIIEAFGEDWMGSREAMEGEHVLWVSQPDEGALSGSGRVKTRLLNGTTSSESEEADVDCCSRAKFVEGRKMSQQIQSNCVRSGSPEDVRLCQVVGRRGLICL